MNTELEGLLQYSHEIIYQLTTKLQHKCLICKLLLRGTNSFGLMRSDKIKSLKVKFKNDLGYLNISA